MKPKTKTILFILLSFILGILCGWFAQERVFKKATHTPPDFQKIMAERLHLDKQQIAQIDSILNARWKQMGNKRNQMLAIRDTTRIDMRKILNEDQRKIFDEMLQEMDARDAKMHERDQQKK